MKTTDEEHKPSLQDFSLIKTHVDKLASDLLLDSTVSAFYYFALDLLLHLQDDEIDDSITDTAYLSSSDRESGRDSGVDALYLDNSQTPGVVHIFNFKYTEKFPKTSNHFPGGEIDKIASFLNALMQQEHSLKDDVNGVLYQKVEEVWSLFESQNPKFVIHICCNLYNSFEESERKRFEKEIGRYSFMEVAYHLMPDFVSLLTNKDRQAVHGKVRAIDKNFFEKSDGDIRALIVDLDARDLIRLVIDDEALRNAVDLDDYASLRQHALLEDAFEDNVRIYLKLRSKINRNIKETALSDDGHRFFYFNNGITLTCDKYGYAKNRRAPIVELENVQVVNGGQTIHALYEAFVEDPSKFDDIDVLCRIYQTNNAPLSTSIAEYTNSQNPVKSRDIRSNDFVQKKLESELVAKGYFYERKKGQHQDQPRKKRIDAEKAGQAILAFFNKMPAEAKDQKKTIFAERYDAVFSDEITADHVLVAVQLFDQIEEKKKAVKTAIMSDPAAFEEKSFLLHSTYYILYLMAELAEVDVQDADIGVVRKAADYYDEAVELLKKAIKREQQKLKGYKETYTHRVFFKGNRPRKHLEDLLSERNEQAETATGD